MTAPQEPLGARLRAWRKNNNLRLADVAERLGLSISYVSDIEHSNRLYGGSADTARKIEALIENTEPIVPETIDRLADGLAKSLTVWVTQMKPTPQEVETVLKKALTGAAQWGMEVKQ